MSYLRIARLTLAAALMCSLGACSSLNKKPAYAGSDGDYVNGSPVTGTPLSERQDGVSFLGNNVERGRFSPVHFGFDSYVVEPSETGKLNEVASFLKSSSKQLVIAGFTDERGTPEYNRGLGERRAEAARSYLISRGVDASRIQTTSFGMEMPVDPGHNESAWAQNRRAEFGVTK